VDSRRDGVFRITISAPENQHKKNTGLSTGVLILQKNITNNQLFY
tara:strand:+ start:38714 stop:38848 length:135 start_codon:yes stop_codon:yes gene_type:complete